MVGIVSESTEWHGSHWNQRVAVRSTSVVQPRLLFDIRVLETCHMPSVTQVIELIVD